MKSCIFQVYGFGKTYDMIKQHGMFQMPRVYRVGGKLLKGVSVGIRAPPGEEWDDVT